MAGGEVARSTGTLGKVLRSEWVAYPASMSNSTAYRLGPARVGITLGVIAAVLAIVHVIAMQIIFNDDLAFADRVGLEYWHLSIFDLDEEASFGTWYSAVILLVASRLLLAQTRVLRAEADKWHPWWLLLGIGFLILSVDEVVGMHELLNSLMEDAPWTVVGFWIVGLVGLSYIPFLWQYRWRAAGLFLLAGAIYVGGAVGVEHWTGSDVNSLHYNMWTTLEEGMEMAGVIVFIYALLDFMPGADRTLRLELSSDT